MELPPRGRGRETHCSSLRPSSRITPAWAGKRRPVRFGKRLKEDYPRVGGEENDCANHSFVVPGLPPRGRGRVVRVSRAHPCPRITPAWAGKRNSSTTFSCRNKDYPRVGGEEIDLEAIKALEAGLPPRGRGRGGGLGGAYGEGGITPAWAGKRHPHTSSSAIIADYPRVGGEERPF